MTEDSKYNGFWIRYVLVGDRVTVIKQVKEMIFPKNFELMVF